MFTVGKVGAAHLRGSRWAEARKTVAFYGFTVASTIILALLLTETGVSWPASILLGAGISATFSGFVYWLIWLAVMCLSRGAPFRVGDRVDITGEKHRGETGVVCEIFEGCYCVRVELDKQADESPGATGSSIAVFNWSEMRRN